MKSVHFFSGISFFVFRRFCSARRRGVNVFTFLDRLGNLDVLDGHWWVPFAGERLGLQSAETLITRSLISRIQFYP